jgi:hypothetical protein
MLFKEKLPVYAESHANAIDRLHYEQNAITEY